MPKTFRSQRRGLRKDFLQPLKKARRSGRFCSERTVREYASGIWRVDPMTIELLTQEDMRARFLQ